MHWVATLPSLVLVLVAIVLVALALVVARWSGGIAERSGVDRLGMLIWVPAMLAATIAAAMVATVLHRAGLVPLDMATFGVCLVIGGGTTFVAQSVGARRVRRHTDGIARIVPEVPAARPTEPRDVRWVVLHDGTRSRSVPVDARPRHRTLVVALDDTAMLGGALARHVHDAGSAVVLATDEIGRVDAFDDPIVHVRSERGAARQGPFDRVILVLPPDQVADLDALGPLLVEGGRLHVVLEASAERYERHGAVMTPLPFSLA